MLAIKAFLYLLAFVLLMIATAACCIGFFFWFWWQVGLSLVGYSKEVSDTDKQTHYRGRIVKMERLTEYEHQLN